MTNELIMWGLPKGSTDPIDEVVLLTNATPERVAKVKELAEKDGYHSFRVVELGVPDFGKAIR